MFNYVVMWYTMWLYSRQMAQRCGALVMDHKPVANHRAHCGPGSKPVRYRCNNFINKMSMFTSKSVAFSIKNI